jgi:hypothetical protein
MPFSPGLLLSRELQFRLQLVPRVSPDSASLGRLHRPCNTLPERVPLTGVTVELLADMPDLVALPAKIR